MTSETGFFCMILQIEGGKEREERLRKMPPTPPWEVLLLVSHYLDPSTLAISSSVSKSWRDAMSSPTLWLPLCLSHFPSSSQLLSLSPPPSPCRLYSLLHLAFRRHPPPPPPSPLLSLRHLVFTLDVFCRSPSSPLLTATIAGDGLDAERCNVFRFDVNVSAAVVEGVEMRVVWLAITKGCGGAFVVMDLKGKGRAVGDTGLWFEEDLQGPRCCPAAEEMGRMVAEVGLVFSGKDRTVGKVSLGLMRRVGCRYVGLRDALLYLQSFLLPPE